MPSWSRVRGGRPRPVVLCVLDGWGYREDPRDNAVALARTPVFDRCWATLPRCFLRTDGPAVGLPEGQMGNSEVGHMNLGAGRVVLQDLPRIDRLLETGGLERSGKIDAIAAKVRGGTGRIHLLGLLSPGGVHAHQRHMAWLARAFARRGLDVWIHAFTDGRDTPPRAALDYIADFRREIAGFDSIRFATVIGRYYAMDRDHRWDRTRRAFEAIVAAVGERAATPEEAIRAAHARDMGDEFIPPFVIDGYEGMADGDGVLCTNFRADRVRQIMTALVDPDFDAFERARMVRFSHAGGMMSYSKELDRFLDVLVPPEDLKSVFGEVVSAAGYTQFRIAETEKYPHVTYFFNGGREQPFPGEERVLVPSPKVSTYDLKPEMSAEPVTDRLVEAIDSGRFDFVLVNYANPDMVGHTGSLEAAIRAVETVDRCLGRLLEAVRRQGGVALVTADHGNCEVMRDPETGQPHTAHTRNPVPCFLFGLERPVRMRNGILADVAPTLLPFLALKRPPEMTGEPLVVEG